MYTRWHLPAGLTGQAPWTLDVTPESAGWSYSGIRVLELAAAQTVSFPTGEDEAILLPLAGSCRVGCGGEWMDLAGRQDVFSAVSDFAYLPIGSAIEVTSDGGGRFALLTARAGRRLPFRYGSADGVPVELRGGGSCSRQVNNFATPAAFETDKLVCCEVITPGGNWSSYPPHKHDTAGPDESVLEEIYYYEIAPGPAGPGVAYQRVYSADERPLDVLAEVRSGDVVLIPHGWHGPSMAAPGFDLYYLNVMAGPAAERAWLISDDPDYAFIRDTWPDQGIDPRLPMTAPGGTQS